jgi:hypothetical protein
MRRLTASNLELAYRCLYPFRPSAGQGAPAGESAGAGTAEHAHIEHTLVTGDTRPRSPIHARWLDTWYVHHGMGPWMAEVAMAMDPVTRAVMRGPRPSDTGPDRYPWAPAGWVPGTADAIQLFVDGEPANELELARLRGADPDRHVAVRVVDWKSGFRARDFLTPTRENMQLLWLGLMAAELYGADEIIAEIVFCRADGVWVDSHRTDPLELRALRDIVSGMFAALRGEDEEALAPKRGPWCADKYCALHGLCPATRGDLARLTDTRKIVMPTSPHEVRSQQHASEVYQVLRAAKAAAEVVWQALRRWTEEIGPIQVAPGVAWGRRTTAPRETIDLGEGTQEEPIPPGVRAIMEVAGPAWPLAVDFGSSKARVRAAARAMADAEKAAGRRASIAAMEARLMDALRAGGHVTTTVSTRVEEFAVTPELLAEYPYLVPPPAGSKAMERIDGGDGAAEEEA